LVDKSLIVTDGSGRYRLLQTLSQYGREQLVARDDNEVVRDRHAEYYRDLAERSWVDWRQAGGRPQTWWMTHLTDELDNLRGALVWSIERADPSTARLLAGSLAFYWWYTGRTAEGHGWLEQALGCPGDAPESSHGLALAWDAFLGIKAGRVDAALDRIADALDVADATGDPATIGLARTAAAELAAFHGHIDVAATHLDHGQLALEAAREPWTSAFAAQMRCYAHGLAGRHADAEREIVTAIELFRSVGDVCSVVTSLDQLIREQQSMARYESVEASVREARRCHEASRLVSGRFRTARGSARSAIQLGYVAEQAGDPDGARRLHLEALEIARERADERGIASAVEGLASAAAASDDNDGAAMLLGHAAQLRANGATPLWDDDRLDVERAEHAVRTQLGDRYGAAFEAGREHALDELLARTGASLPAR
jgi:tetratricopeptide (TPR) repeat protein